MRRMMTSYRKTSNESCSQNADGLGWRPNHRFHRDGCAGGIVDNEKRLAAGAKCKEETILYVEELMAIAEMSMRV